MRNPDPRCGTPLLYSGELQVRPELEAAMKVLDRQPYTAIPGWNNDGTWELWTVTGDGQTSPRIISGPQTRFPSREAALEAGAQLRPATALPDCVGAPAVSESQSS